MFAIVIDKSDEKKIVIVKSRSLQQMPKEIRKLWCGNLSTWIINYYSKTQGKNNKKDKKNNR